MNLNLEEAATTAGSSVAQEAPWRIVSIDLEDLLSSRCLELLAAAGRPCKLERIDSELELVGSLRRIRPDIVWVVSRNGREPARVIDLLRERDLDVPLLVLALRSNPRRAADMLRLGAADVIPQRELARLEPVMAREARAAEARRHMHRLRHEAAHGPAHCAHRDATVQALLDAIPHPIWLLDASSDHLRGNRHFEDLAALPGSTLTDHAGNGGDSAAGTIRELLLLQARRVQDDGRTGTDTIQELFDGEYGSKALRIVQQPMRGDTGEWLGLVGIAVDVSEHKQNEADLLETTGLLADAIDSSPAAFYYVDAQQRLQLWNRKVLELFPMFEPLLRKGMLMEDFLRQAAPSYLGPDIDVEAYVRGRMARLLSPPQESFEYETAHGRIVMVLDRTSSRGGRVITTVDVTDIRRKERALAASEANFHKVLRHTADGVYIAQRRGALLQVNPQFCTMTGYSEAELLDMKVTELFASDAQRSDFSSLRRFMTGQPTLLVRPLLCKDGRRIVVEANVILQPDGNFLSIVRDITARAQGEQELRDSRRLLQGVFDTIPFNLYVKDLHGRYVTANRAFTENNGKPLEAIIGRQLEELDARPQWELDRVARQDGAVLSGTIERVDEIHAANFPNSPQWTMHTIKTPLRDEEGRIFGLVGISIDVTEAEAARAALQQERELLKTVFDTLPHEVYVKDSQGHYLLVNHASANNYEKIGSLNGRTFSDMVERPQEERDEVAAMDRAVCSGEVTAVDRVHTVTMPDGRGHVLHTIKKPLRGKAGEIIGLVGVSEDITAQVTTQNALKEQQQLLQAVFNTIPHHVHVKDRAARFVAVNRTTLAFGRTPEELIGKTVLDVAPPGFPEWQQVLDAELRILRGEQARMDEVLWLRLTDGSKHAIRFVKEPLKDEQGKIYGLVGLSEHVTELELAHAAVRENQLLLQTIIETMPQGLLVKDRDLRYLVVNRQAANMLGLDQNEAIGKTPGEFAKLNWSWQRALQMDHSILNGSSTHERDMLRLRRPDGTPRWIMLTKEPLLDQNGSVSGIVSIGEDITELYAARAEATEAHATLYDAIQHLWAGFYLYDKYERLLLWNERTCDMFPPLRGKLRKGMSFEEVLRAGVDAVEFPDPSLEAYIQRRLAEFRHPGETSHERRLKDGRWLLVRDRRTSTGGTVSLRHEITDLKRSEQALRASEQRFRLLTESAPDLIFSYRLWPEPGFDYVSPLAEDLCGYGPAEHYADPELWTRIVHPEDRQKQEAIFEAGALSVGGLVSLRWRHRNGKWIWLEQRCTPMRDDQGQVVGIAGIVRDVTQRKLLEDQLLQAQRMEAVGQLAGGVAHDFNNMLMVMSSYSDLVLDGLQPDSQAADDVKMIQHAVTRSTELTRQLLAFSRKQIMRIQHVDLNELITQMGKILRRVIGEDIRLDMQLALDLDLVSGDPGQIEQIVMNLAVNARDAMPLGGRLTLKTSNLTLGAGGTSFDPGLSPGCHVELAVADTGTGMPKEILSRIFEPFFTTKEVGKGTGLGLSMVYGIARQMGGDVQVASEPGVGTEFKLILPCDGEHSLQQAPPPESRTMLSGSESILLVEDQNEVRVGVKRTLEKFGYKVISASGAADAEAIFQEAGDSIHLVLTDIVMPGTNGPAMVKRLAAWRSDLKVLYMTGYAESSIFQQVQLEGEKDILMKPFTPHMLLQHVRKALNSGGS